jgi:hypothetical protein
MGETHGIQHPCLTTPKGLNIKCTLFLQNFPQTTVVFHLVFDKFYCSFALKKMSTYRQIYYQIVFWNQISETNNKQGA